MENEFSSFCRFTRMVRICLEPWILHLSIDFRKYMRQFILRWNIFIFPVTSHLFIWFENKSAKTKGRKKKILPTQTIFRLLWQKSLPPPLFTLVQFGWVFDSFGTFCIFIQFDANLIDLHEFMRVMKQHSVSFLHHHFPFACEFRFSYERWKEVKKKYV